VVRRCNPFVEVVCPTWFDKTEALRTQALNGTESPEWNEELAFAVNWPSSTPPPPVEFYICHKDDSGDRQIAVGAVAFPRESLTWTDIALPLRSTTNGEEAGVLHLGLQWRFLVGTGPGRGGNTACIEEGSWALPKREAVPTVVDLGGNLELSLDKLRRDIALKFGSARELWLLEKRRGNPNSKGLRKPGFMSSLRRVAPLLPADHAEEIWAMAGGGGCGPCGSGVVDFASFKFILGGPPVPLLEPAGHSAAELDSNAMTPTAPKISKKKEQQLRQIFETCDRSGDGEVSRSELIMACRRSEEIADFFSLPKRFLKESETGLLEAWFAAGDADGSGQMTWEELRDFYIRSQSQGGWQIDEDAIKAAIDAKKAESKSKPATQFIFNAAKEDRLRRIFMECDKSNDGQVSKRELIKACTRNKAITELFQVPSGTEQEQAIEDIFEGCDSDGDGCLTWEELRDFYIRTEGKMGAKRRPTKAADGLSLDVEEKLRKVFNTCDKSGDGQISKSELILACRRDESISELFHLPKRFLKPSETESLEQFFDVGDKDSDGQLSWEELREFYVQTQGRMAADAEKKKPGERTPTPTNRKAPAFIWNSGKEDRLRRIFDELDRSHDGKVDQAELALVCKKNKGIQELLGLPSTGPELDTAINELFLICDGGEMGDGQLTWEEFRDAYVRAEGKLVSKRKSTRAADGLSAKAEARLRQIFTDCDKSGDGCITKSELVLACKRDESIPEFFHLPVKFDRMSEIEALDLFLQVGDKDGDGSITWDELRDFYVATQGKMSTDDSFVRASLQSGSSAALPAATSYPEQDPTEFPTIIANGGGTAAEGSNGNEPAEAMYDEYCSGTTKKKH
jgi:Ca2+-binding EF-hand superfamily protein